MPGGADWQYVRGDGVVELVARYSIRTGDGAEIAVTNRGLRRAAPEVMERMSRGEAVDPALVYFRTVPVFEAPAGAYDWLNRSVFVATAARLPDKVQITRVRGAVGVELGAARAIVIPESRSRAIRDPGSTLSLGPGSTLDAGRDDRP